MSTVEPLDDNPPRTRKPLHWAAITGLVLLSCVLLFYISVYYTNGWFYCSEYDLWLQSSPCQRTLPSAGGLHDVTFAPGSTTLVITSVDAINIWDARSGTQLGSIPYALGRNEGYSRRSRFSPDGKLLATTGETGLQVVDFAAKTLLYTIPSKHIRASGIAFSPDGTLVALSGNDLTGKGEVRIFEAATGALRYTIPGRYVLDRSDLRFSPDSIALLIWVDRTVQGWSFSDSHMVQEIDGSPQVSPDGATIFAYGDRATDILAFDPATHSYRLQRTIPSKCTTRDDVAFLPHTSNVLIVASSTYDDLIYPSMYPTICIWNLTDGSVRWESVAQGYCVDVTSDGRLAAVCRRGVQIWKIPPAWLE